MTAPRPRYFKSDLPEGRSGEWVLERFEVGSVDAAAPPRPEPFASRPGRYTRLKRGPTVYMTDLYDEWWSQRSAMGEALRRGGHVLISGLGLGLVVESILRPAESPVESVTVLERSPDVVRLAAPHLVARYGERLRVAEVDAFAWEPPDGRRFSVVWHDIWPNPFADPVFGEIERLHRRYAGVCDWQGSWPLDYLEAAGLERGGDGRLRRRR